MEIPTMAGTLLPQQMQQQNQQQSMQQAIIEALRNNQQQAAPAQAGEVTTTGAFGDGMDTNAIGGAIKKGYDWLGNTGTANTYGTNPFSQQTSMLAAQDAFFK
jgi:hypothetical protein